MTQRAKAPSKGTKFRLTDWTYRDDMPGITFGFECDVYGQFEEVIVFPELKDLASSHDGVQDRLIRLLHGALGASYYKCAAAAQIQFETGPWAEHEKTLMAAVYGPGLGEFFVRSGLGYPHPASFDWGTGEAITGKAQTAHSQIDALIGFGGGKDSYVAMDVARRAMDNPRFFKIRSHLAAPSIVAPDTDELHYFDRFLDPKLREVNAAGAYNGHVPVTAMNSLIAMLAAKLMGVPHVIFANERSADEGTADIGGHSVNHQFSKTIVLEEALRKAAGPGAPNYFSLLRPVSEIWIARHLAGLPELHEQFISCNRNFRIGNKEAPIWCGDCPKCAFTFLLFSPFLSKERLVSIFRDNLLDKESLLPVYEELTGLRNVKPWECVGTIEECRTIFHLIGKRKDWSEDHIVQALLPRLCSVNPGFNADKALCSALSITQPHFVPPRFLTALKRAGDEDQARSAGV